MTASDDAFPRDENGRFLPGNPGGPGRPPSRGKLLRQAAEDAITPEHVAAIIRKATRLALEGDVAAARLVLDRVCGRTPEAPSGPEPVEIALPPLRTAADCNAAIDRLTEAICGGSINREQATLLMGIVQTRLKAIEVNELELRLTELEKHAATVVGAHERNGRHR